MNKKMRETCGKTRTGLPIGSMVKLLNEGSFKKKRMNYSRDAYKINFRDGNQYIVEAKDKSVGQYPGYKLHEAGSNAREAKTLNDDRYGIVDKIMSFNPKRNKYRLVYEGGVKDMRSPNILRKGNPTRLSIAEAEYWNKMGGKNKLPEDIRRLV
jgi:hypothetical protein